MKRKLTKVIFSCVIVVIIGIVGTFIYFNLGGQQVNSFDDIDPNSKVPVTVNLTEEDIANMTDEEKAEWGIEDWD